MVENNIDKFIEQLKRDTMSGAVTWTNLSLVPKGFFDLNDNISTILFEHAHSVVIKKLSYKTNNHPSGAVYLITRRLQSMKGNELGVGASTQYELYVQRHELESCISVKAKRADLIELSTIIRNITYDQTQAAEDQQVNDFINDYLTKSKENDI